MASENEIHKTLEENNLEMDKYIGFENQIQETLKRIENQKKNETPKEKIHRKLKYIISSYINEKSVQKYIINTIIRYEKIPNSCNILNIVFRCSKKTRGSYIYNKDTPFYSDTDHRLGFKINDVDFDIGNKNVIYDSFVDEIEDIIDFSEIINYIKLCIDEMKMDLGKYNIYVSCQRNPRCDSYEISLDLHRENS